MHYVCKYCGPTGEWHFEHQHRSGCMVPMATRDDLIRLVVGMQWAVACAMFDPLDVKDFSESVVLDDGPRRRVAAMRPACDIVDEWLGVR